MEAYSWEKHWTTWGIFHLAPQLLYLHLEIENHREGWGLRIESRPLWFFQHCLQHVRLPQGDLVLEPQTDLGYVGSRLLKSNAMASDGFSGHDIAGQSPQAINFCTAEAAFIGNEKSAKVTQEKSKIKTCQLRLDIIFRSYAQIFRKFSEVFAASPSTSVRSAAQLHGWHGWIRARTASATLTANRWRERTKV